MASGTGIPSPGRGDPLPVPALPPALAAAIDRYRLHLTDLRRLAANTVQAYLSDLMLFGQALAKAGVTEPGAVGPDSIRDYLRQGREQGLAPRSQARKLAALRGFFRLLLAEGIVAADPCTEIDCPRPRRPLPKVLSLQEVDRLLAPPASAADSLAFRNHAMLQLLYATGLRVSELVRLPLTACQLAAGYLRVCGKGDKERLVPFGEEAQEAVKTYATVHRPLLLGRRRSSYLFVTSRGTAMTRARFWQIIEELRRTLAIDTAVSPHVL
ncbi:MAG: tyrosine-type recombinase/integrase, partial [Thermodesulfobacteriota bacterium]